MYPNPQDVLPLPPHPDLHHYRRRAKDLAKACRSGDATAIRAWAARWVGDLVAHHSEAEHGRRRGDVERRIDQVAGFAHERMLPDCKLTQAQFVIARAHGFESWPRLAHHLEALGGPGTRVSAFEEAADAIVDGDLPALARLLREDPGLVRARSTREHRATLLHYVAANGVENYRQITPPNIVDIAGSLLDAGAEVDAEADVYGGGATTLGLVVTSAHPRLAGVQEELADLLLARGARLDPGSVRSCLMNGCPEAAAHLARLGLAVDLDEAAGIEDLEAMRRILDGDGRSGAKPTKQKLAGALLMAAWYDRRAAVALLIDRGVDPGIPDDSRNGEGATALHVAAYEGHDRLVELLLKRGAPVKTIDDHYRTPPIVWALHAWLVENKGPPERYRAILLMLANAGADVKPEWIDDERIRADPDLRAILGARVQPS